MIEVKADSLPATIVEDEADPKYTSMMAVHHALHAEPVEFEKSVNALLADRIQNAVEKHREQVANDIFGNPNQEPEVDDLNQEEDGTEETGELESESESELEDEETPSEE